jgi:hypothetical protein
MFSWMLSGLVVLLSSQFYDYEFAPILLDTGYGAPSGGFITAIGGYFHVKFPPPTWPAGDRYSFRWQVIENDPDPFQTLTF